MKEGDEREVKHMPVSDSAPSFFLVLKPSAPMGRGDGCRRHPQRAIPRPPLPSAGATNTTTATATAAKPLSPPTTPPQLPPPPNHCHRDTASTADAATHHRCYRHNHHSHHCDCHHHHRQPTSIHFIPLFLSSLFFLIHSSFLATYPPAPH